MGEANRATWVERIIGNADTVAHDTVSANLVGRIIAAAVARGASKPAILEEVGITEATIRNQLNRLSGQILIRLFAAIEKQTGDPAVALKIGRDSKPGCFSDLGYATRLLPTLREVLAANIHMQPMRQTVFRVILVETDDTFNLEWELFDNDPDLVAAAVEFSVSTYVRLAREICGNDLVIRNVQLRHHPRFALSKYVKILGAPVTFNADRTAICIDPAQCASASPLADIRLFAEAARRHGQAVEWLDAGHRHSAFTYFYVVTELNKSPVTLERVARSFGMAERTLRRHLVDEGHPFRMLLDHARQNLCDLYRMENRRSLSAVAELLGYGELSAFTRAYRRWYGDAPSRNWTVKTID